MSDTAHALTHADLLAQESKRYHEFVNLALFLSVFTGIEIIIIFMPFAGWLVFASLVSLSIIKFFCVIFWFMHLIYDRPLLTILFLAGMAIAAGTMIALLGLMSPNDIDQSILSYDATARNIAPLQMLG